LNLKEANANGEANWKELYTFKSYYGIDDLSAQSLELLAQSFLPGVDDA